MKFKSAIYSRSIYLPEDIPEEMLPQFLFIGRSNVGKSSLINSVSGVDDLCRTGKTPGVTKRVNLFLVNNCFYFADLPGYGYAQASKKERKDLTDLIFWYLEESIKYDTRAIFLLIDSRLGPTAPDLEVMRIFKKLKIKPVFILSKIDQVKPSQINQVKFALEKIQPNSKFISYSSRTNAGQKELRNYIHSVAK
jgi:GTP-binding protein